jgi:replicative DNA helicase
MVSVSGNIIGKRKENERYFAGSIFSGSADIAIKECSWLEPDQFTDKELGEYWAKVRAGEDPLQVANSMGLMTDLMGYMNKTPNVVRPQEYARGIAEYSYTYRIVDGAKKLVKSAQDNDLAEINDELGRMLGLDTGTVVEDDLYSSKEVADQFDKMLTTPQPPSIMTYIPAIDDIVGGLFGGELITLAGRPGMGKTALALQIARNIASSGRRALFFSLEMHRMQLWARMACGLAGYEWRDVRSGNVGAKGKQAILQKSQWLASQYGDNLMIADKAGETVTGMIQLVAHSKPDFVVVDHLGEVGRPVGKREEKEVVWYGNTTRDIRIWIARRFHIPVLLVHQLSRAVEERNPPIPILSDLRWSGEIEQRSDAVWMMYRDDYYNPNDNVLFTGKSEVELWQRKHRQGAMNAKMLLTYDLKKQWFN